MTDASKKPNAAMVDLRKWSIEHALATVAHAPFGNSKDRSHAVVDIATRYEQHVLRAEDS